jgi:branched-chain amino acid transport system permease protein
MKKLSYSISLLAILGILPQILPAYYTGILVRIMTLIIFAMSINILMGYVGLTPLGQAAYFGFSGYTVALLNLEIFQGARPFLEIGAGIMASLLCAALLGLFVVRAKGVYFMMVTLAIGEMFWGLAVKWQHFTGGADGLAGILRPQFGFLPFWDLSGETGFFYFVFVLFCLSCLFIYLLLISPFGLTLSGIKENESRMEILGFNIWLHKYIAFIIAGAFAGLAGTLDVYYYQFVSPEILGVGNSIGALLAVILGGSGTLFGPIIGSALYISLEQFISGYTQRWVMIMGLLFILIVLFAPMGLSRLLSTLWSSIRGRAKGSEAT